MKIVDCRTCLLAAALCWAAGPAYGQAAAELDQSTPHTAGQGQDTAPQQSLQDAQTNKLDASPNNLGQQGTQLEQSPIPDQQAELGQPGGQQDPQRMRSPGQLGDQGMAGQSQRGVLGVMITESAGPGVMIREVLAGSAAEQAGLQPGDVILQINGEGVDSPPAVTQMIREIPAGQRATLHIWRDGQEDEIPVTLQAAQRPPYRTNFRGGEESSLNGDETARIARLESQLAAVMRELQQLRQEVMQLRTGRAGQPSATTGTDAQLVPDATEPAFGQPPATPPGIDETPAEPPTEPDPALPF